MKSRKKSYIRLDRKIQDHWLWQEKPFSKAQAWIDLLMSATYKDYTDIYNGEVIKKSRGSVYTSVVYLSEKWGWSRNKVLRFLRTLESEEMVTTNGTPNGTTITIENYNFYQSPYTTDGTTDETPHGTTDGTTDETTGGTLKNNIYKINNINNNQKQKEEEEELRLKRLKAREDLKRRIAIYRSKAKC